MNESKRNTLKKISGVALASVAAGMFMTATIDTAAAAEAKVNCMGINSCKGKTDCKSSKNECKGKNNCKGQGFKAVSAKECKKKGGEVEKSDKSEMKM
jgi:hypothetical protein